MTCAMQPLPGRKAGVFSVMDIQTFVDPIRIRRAVLGFSGWPDAGKTIQHAFGELNTVLQCRSAAAWDLDGYWHTESSRPLVSVHHGRIKSLDWPTYRFSLCTPRQSEPILLGMGPEPSIHWRPFARKFLKILEGWGCREILLLGSVYDDIFHDEVLLTGVVQDAEGYNLVRDLGCSQIEYSGPGAIHAVIMEMAADLQMKAYSIWSHFPSYLNASHELLIARILRMMGDFLKLEFKTDHLLRSWKKREKEIEELIENDEEVRQVLDSIRQADTLQAPVHTPATVIQLDEFIRRRQERLLKKE